MTLGLDDKPQNFRKGENPIGSRLDVRSMELSVKTRGNSPARGKRKVFFTSHPDDFDKYIDIVCEDIFHSQDCAIYYATVEKADCASKSEEATEEGKADDGRLELREMNLFVIPVTYKLLTEPNRAMNEDYVFAKEHHIPILPIMMEKEIDHFYEEKFDKIEYLNRLETDATSIGYARKLAGFLEAVLISDEMSAKIRAAFDAYIFLSYRKKDRKYANELMRLIHRNPLCRDIAIWYDEFLVPGEDFEDTIKAALEKSNLFTMVVTPNVMEPGNYVLVYEYPEAFKRGKTILPVEMVDTDATQLAKMFQGIPACANRTGDDAFYQRILEILAANGRVMQKENPEHNFLVGLAYLDGINVEKDYQHGMELITIAADSGLPEAMEKLGEIYENGIGVEIDYEKSRAWMEKAMKRAEDLYGTEDEKTLEIAKHLAKIYSYLCELDKAKELANFVYETRKKHLGEEHQETLNALRALANLFIQAGSYQEALEYLGKVSAGLTKLVGEDHPDTLDTYQNIVNIYMLLSDYQKTEEMATILYEKSRKTLGDYHVTTLLAREWIAAGRAGLGAYQEALDALEQIYVDAQEHLKDDWILSEVAAYMGEIYAMDANFEKAIEKYQLAYGILEKLVGPEHPVTIFHLFRMATVYDDMGLLDKAYEIYVKSYDCFKKNYGEKHLNTLMVFSKMADICGIKGDLEKAVEMHKKTYHDLVETVGEEHSEVVVSLRYLLSCYLKLEDYEKALETAHKEQELCKKMYGEDGPLTLQTSGDLPDAYFGAGQYEKAFELGLKAYENIKRVFGEDYFLTYVFHLHLGKYYFGIGEYEKAIEILEEELERLGEILSPEDLGLLPVKYYLVTAYAEKGNIEKALEIGEALLETDLRVFGEDHHATLKLKKKLEEIRNLS